jgi:uncharacterized protein
MAAGPAVVSCVAPAGPAVPDPPASSVRIATGNAGGVYLAYGTGLAEAVRARLPSLTPTVLETDASVQNLRMLMDGRAEVAFTLADAAAPHSRDVVALARLYENYLQLVVRESSPVRSVADLAGRTVSVGSAGSGTAVAARRVLGAAGVAVDGLTLSLQESTDALAAGTIEAMFWSGGLPTAAITDLRARTPLRLVDLAGVAAGLAEEYRDFYTEAAVPASAYGQGTAVTTVSVPNYLVVRRDLDEEVAYALTWLLFTERERMIGAHPEARRLDLRAAIATHPLDLHPGAARYYRAARN